MLKKIKQLLYCFFHGYWINDPIWKSRKYNILHNDYIDLSGD